MNTSITLATVPVRLYHPGSDHIPAGDNVAILGWAFICNSDDARITTSESYRNRLVDAGVLKWLMGQEHPVIVDGRNVVNADGFMGGKE